jgi:hypothetical protein
MTPLDLHNVWLHLVVPVASLALGIILYRRDWARLYPAFFAFLSLTVARSAVFVPLGMWYTRTHNIGLYKIYFYSYWYLQAAETLLVFIILYRIFSAAFSSYSILRRWTFVIFMLALAACLILGTFVAPPSIRTRGVATIAFPLWKSSMLLRAGLLAFLFLFVFGIGIRLRDYLFGIAAGFGAQAVIILSIDVLKPRLTWVTNISIVADLIACAIWFVYLWLPRSQPKYAGDLSFGSQESSRWKEVLSEFLHK